MIEYQKEKIFALAQGYENIEFIVHNLNKKTLVINGETVEVINGKANISLLASYLTDLIGSGKTSDQTDKIVNTISSKSFSNNNTILTFY